MTKLKVIDAEPIGVDVVATLESVLERAREGRISSVAIAMVYRDGSTNRTWSKSPSLSALVGAVARLLAALIRMADSD